MPTSPPGGKLLAISDLHVVHPENRRIVEGLVPESDDDWLLVAGDVGDTYADVEWALTLLRARFSTVVWAPGNHELWTINRDPVQAVGEERYQLLVRLCRDLGVLTPEDPYPVWSGAGGPAVIAPLFVLYDYTFRMPGVDSKEQALALAEQAGVVGTDEVLLNPAPYPSRDAWCRARLEITRARLDAIDPTLPTVLVNHFPLVRQPTDILWYPQFALWCGTVHTADWHRRYRSAAVVYGHLHIPRTLWYDGVPFYEVSLGYPREWQPRATRPGQLRQILRRPPAPPPAPERCRRDGAGGPRTGRRRGG